MSPTWIFGFKFQEHDVGKPIFSLSGTVSQKQKDDLLDKHGMEAPQQMRQSVEQFKIVNEHTGVAKPWYPL